MHWEDSCVSRTKARDLGCAAGVGESGPPAAPAGGGGTEGWGAKPTEGERSGRGDLTSVSLRRMGVQVSYLDSDQPSVKGAWGSDHVADCGN